MAEQHTPTRPGLAWEYLAHSEIGLVRKNNQDSGLVSARMLMVADGMGGAAAGDLASAVAVDTMIEVDHQLAGPQAADPENVPPADDQAGDQPSAAEPADDTAVRDKIDTQPPPAESETDAEDAAEQAESEASQGSSTDPDASTDPLELLAGGISAANTRISDLVATDYALEGMGTTVTAVALDGDGIGLAHIGDSRAYLFRDGELQQLTHDHSWVQSLIDDGKISESEAATHPHRSLLLKVLNGQPANEPDLSTVPLQLGDRLLLCSDGLCGFVEDDAIAEALTGTSRDRAMDRLIDAAHAAGGLDNITIIVADLVDRPSVTGAAESAAAEGPTGSAASGTTEAGTARAISAGAISTELLGAAAEHDLQADEEEIRQRVVDREAAGADDDDEYDEYEDAEEGEDEDRYAPQVPSRRRWRRPLLLTLVVVLIIGVVAGAGYAWTRTQYYVGAKNSQVAIFQGLSQSVPGIPLSHVYEVQDLQLADLPAYYQGLVRATINTGSLDSARATVQQLRETAVRCGTTGAGTDPATSPSPTATSSPTSTATSKSGKKPTKKTTSKSSPKHTPTSKDTSKSKPSSKKPSPKSSSPASSPSPTATSSGELPQSGRC